MKNLTAKQKAILDFVHDFSRQQGMAPTIYEISEHFSIKPASACSHIKALQQKGYVTRSSKARSLSLCAKSGEGRHFSMFLSIPLLGRISAGVAGLSEAHRERKLNIDSSLIPKGIHEEDLFALRVQGESMRDLGIFDGDVVIAHRTEKIKIGDIIIAMVDGDCTVKSLYLTDGAWELRPANPEFSSRMVPLNDLSVQGVVVALMRSL